jgi:hypothetical protein
VPFLPVLTSLPPGIASSRWSVALLWVQKLPERVLMFSWDLLLGHSDGFRTVDVSEQRVDGRHHVLTPAGNWEGFSPEPYLAGQIVAETVKGIQSSGVVATTKHYIANEQEVSTYIGR